MLPAAIYTRTERCRCPRYTWDPPRHMTSFWRHWDVYTKLLLLYRRLNEIETTLCVYWYGIKYKNLKLTQWLQLTYLHLCAGGAWPASVCTIFTLFKACSFFKKFYKVAEVWVIVQHMVIAYTGITHVTSAGFYLNHFYYAIF